MAVLQNIFRYPVKGLNGERLGHVALEAGKPIIGDRKYALALASTIFDPANPHYLAKHHFLMLMRDEKLAELDARFSEDGSRITISHQGEEVLNAVLTSPDDIFRIETFFAQFMAGKIKDHPRLVSADGHMFSDVREQCLSLINLASVRDLEEKTGLRIDPMRFRGNLYIDGLEPWQEFDLVGKKVQIGDITFHAFKRIERCAATNVNLETAIRDMNIPLTLRKTYGHMDCGIYLDVIEGGTLHAGDTISL